MFLKRISYSFRVDVALAAAAKVILEGGNCLLFGDVFTLVVQCRGHVSKKKSEQKLYKNKINSCDKISFDSSGMSLLTTLGIQRICRRVLGSELLFLFVDIFHFKFPLHDAYDSFTQFEKARTPRTWPCYFFMLALLIIGPESGYWLCLSITH